MFGRKIFTAFLASLGIVFFFAMMGFISSETGPFGAMVFGFSLYAVPIVFVYGIFTSVLSEQLSSKLSRFSRLFSFTLHYIFALSFFILCNLILFQEPFGFHILFLGLFGSLFFLIDRTVHYFWEKGDLKYANRSEN